MIKSLAKTLISNNNDFLITATCQITMVLTLITVLRFVYVRSLSVPTQTEWLPVWPLGALPAYICTLLLPLAGARGGLGATLATLSTELGNNARLLPCMEFHHTHVLERLLSTNCTSTMSSSLYGFGFYWMHVPSTRQYYL